MASYRASVRLRATNIFIGLFLSDTRIPCVATIRVCTPKTLAERFEVVRQSHAIDVFHVLITELPRDSQADGASLPDAYGLDLQLNWVATPPPNGGLAPIPCQGSGNDGGFSLPVIQSNFEICSLTATFTSGGTTVVSNAVSYDSPTPE
jgi:hypothetical protein